MAATFSLGAIIQAGDTGSVYQELRLGASTSSLSAGGSSLWVNGQNQDVRLSYDNATNTATLEADHPLATFSMSWLVTGGVAGSAISWQIPTSGLSVIADNNTAQNTQIRLRNISISGTGFSTINPANLVANQTGAGTVTTSTPSPITFTTAAGGSWMLSGQIRFTGLGSPGAVGDDLRMALNIQAVTAEVPEPSTLLLGALGLAGLGVLHHFRARRLRKAKLPLPPARQAKA